MKDKGNYTKLISSIDSLLAKLQSGKFPNAYYTYQYLCEIKKDLSIVIDPEIDSTYSKLSPIINKINYEFNQLKNGNSKQSSTKLNSLLDEAGPIVSQCRTHLHFAEKKAKTNVNAYSSSLMNIRNPIPKTKSKLEKASYIAAIVGAIATIIGVVIAYYSL